MSWLDVIPTRKIENFCSSLLPSFPLSNTGLTVMTDEDDGDGCLGPRKGNGFDWTFLM